MLDYQTFVQVESEEEIPLVTECLSRVIALHEGSSAPMLITKEDIAVLTHLRDNVFLNHCTCC